MTFVTVPGGGMWIPKPQGELGVAASLYVIDVDGEKCVLVCRAPRAGDLDRFDAFVATVTNSPDNGLRFSFQGVDTNGQPDGTVLGATNNALVDYAHTVTTGWKSTNFGETVTVTRNQLIACVINIPTFTAGDSVAIGHITNFIPTSAFPYGISATSTKGFAVLPRILLHYTDGYVVAAEAAFPIDSITNQAYNSGTGTADEYGLAFSLPFNAKIERVTIYMAAAAGADFEVLLYDTDGTTVLSTLAHDGDVTGAANRAGYEFVLASEVTLTRDATYRLTLRPTTANSVTLSYWAFANADYMGTCGGGTAMYLTTQLNQGGTWTNYNNGTDGYRRPNIGLYVTEVDDGAGGASGAAPIFVIDG